MKKILVRLIGLAVVLGAGWWGYRLFQQMPQRQQQIPTTRVRRGDVVVRSYARGELRAVRSATLTAPNLFGTVQVTRMAPLGAFAREKDLVVEFDDAEVLSRLEEKQLELEQIDEQMKKAEADLAIRNNQDQVELLRTRYMVTRAQLEVKRNELISEIDAKKNILSLEEARQRLKQLESDIRSRLDQAQAELAVLKERRNKATLEMAREKGRLSQVKLLAPISGLVAIKQNRGGFGMMGMQVPDIREGDQVQPGMPVADVLDLSELEVVAKVGELDRANLREGQEVVLRLDAVPDKTFTGQIKAMSGTASANMWSADPAKKFDVVFSIDMKQLLTALGAKPEQVRRVLETAEQNRKKPQPASFASTLGAGGMPGFGPGGAGGPEGMMAAGPGAMSATGPGGDGAGQLGVFRAPGAPGEAGGGGRGGRGGGGFGQMSDEDRQKMREAMQKALGGRSMQDLSPEERQKMFEKLRASMPAGAKAQAGARPESGAQAEGGGRRRREGGDQGGERAGGEGRGRRGSVDMPALPAGFGMGAAARFSEKDLANAKLPPAPEEDTQLDVLLRPGLLSDVEIIVEKIPDAIHIPNQSVFEREGKLVVYVKTSSGFEPRLIKPLKRSESTMVVAEGLKAGELIALANPVEKPGSKKKGDKKQETGNPMGAMPTGGPKS